MTDSNPALPGTDTITTRSRSLADQVYDYLKQAIVGGQFSVGDKLPTEQSIASSCQVSRSVVREAITRLKSDGLVRTKQGSGAFVAEPSEARSFRLEVGDLRNAREITQTIELLIAFEVGATEIAAIRAGDEDLEELAVLYEDIDTAIANGDNGTDEDMRFHRKIVTMTRNQHYMDLADVFEGSVRRFIRAARRNSARNAHLVHDAQSEHHDILLALQSRDARAAREAARNHLQNAAKRLKIYLDLE